MYVDWRENVEKKSLCIEVLRKVGISSEEIEKKRSDEF